MKAFILCFVVVVVTGNSLHNKVEPCDLLDCRAGRECIVDDGVAQCVCKISCLGHLKPVCGTDEKSYDNHCLMHQHACVTGMHISVEHKGYCKTSKKKNKRVDDRNEELKMKLANDIIADIETESAFQSIPQVHRMADKHVMAACYSSQREAMRYLLVGYWTENAENQPWFKSNMREREQLWGFFYTCDVSKDNNLTPLELLDCAEKVEFYPRPGQNKMETKALCIEAIIEDGDLDNDVKLDFNEFTRIMNSKYMPKDKYCSLNRKTYTDGEEVDKLCNHCVCAIGSWVCTPSNCESKKKDAHKNHVFQPGDFDNNVYQQFDDDHITGMDISHKKHLSINEDLNFDTGLNTNFEEDLQKGNTYGKDTIDFATGSSTDFDDDLKQLLEEDAEVDTKDDLGIDDYLYEDIEDKTMLKTSKKEQYNIELALKKLKQLEKETKETEELLMKSLKQKKEAKRYKQKDNFEDTYAKKKLQKYKQKMAKKNLGMKSLNKNRKDKIRDETPWMDLLHFKNFDTSKFDRDLQNDI